ncbi:MAG: hypothetical protein HY553_15910 [Elusimicrobia bacterium]|nr:hypothetical protein [Elusimicrobiota bacterium]
MASVSHGLAGVVAAPAAVTLTVPMPLTVRMTVAVSAAAPAVRVAGAAAPFMRQVHRELARTALPGRRTGTAAVFTVAMAHDHLLGIRAIRVVPVRVRMTSIR